MAVSTGISSPDFQLPGLATWLVNRDDASAFATALSYMRVLVKFSVLK